MTSEDRHRRFYTAFQVVFLAGPSQSAAQFGWWQACSVRGEVGPGWFPPPRFVLLCTSGSTQMYLSPLPVTAPTPYPWNPKARQSLSCSSYLRSLSLFPLLPWSPILPFLAFPRRPPPPRPSPSLSLLPPKCIPAWQTTWDFTSPLKSAASGNHSSPCNILVFKGIRDWGGNQPGNLLYSSCLLLVVNSVDALQEEKKIWKWYFYHVIIIDRCRFPLFLVTLEIFLPWFLNIKHLVSRCRLLKSFFFLILAHKSITTTIYKFLVIFKTKTHLYMQQ